MQISPGNIFDPEHENDLYDVKESNSAVSRGDRVGLSNLSKSEPSRAGKRGRAAVIGSGFGGLAAAIRLQSMGFETVCFEGRDQPGGRAYVYRDAGFTFDAGPTVITAPHCIEELFELSGRSMQDYVQLILLECI